MSLAPLPTPAGTPMGRILRVGVLHDGLMVAEAFLPPEQSDREVSIGDTARADIYVPWDTGLRHAVVFKRRAGRWHLVLVDGLEGELVKDEKSHAIARLRASGQKKAKPGADLLVPLDAQATGKLTLASAKIYFQFTERRPKRLGLPLRNPFVAALQRLEPALANAFFVSAFAIIGTIGGAMALYPPQEDARNMFITAQNVKMLIEDAPEPPPPESDAPPEKPAEKSDEAEAKAEAPKAAPKKAAEPSKPADPKAARVALQESVTKRTILQYFAATKDGDTPNIISKDELWDGKMREAFDGTALVLSDRGTAGPSGRGLREGGSTQGTVAGLGDGDLSGGGTGVVETGTTRELKVKSNVKAEAVEEMFGGTLDRNVVSQTVQRRISAIKTCYERELKSNPALAGKVVVQFTIEESGRVGASKVLSDTTGEPRIGQCIAATIGRFKFPSPEGGAVTASYPFVLQPGT